VEASKSTEKYKILEEYASAILNYSRRGIVMILDVGSIIYIIDPNKKSVIPARVNEQLVSKTLKGENVTHNIEVPNGKVLSLESLDTAFFSSLEEVHDFLLDRAKEMIDIGIQEAKQVAEEKFADHKNIKHSEQPGDTLGVTSENNIMVTLDNGRSVNVKIPEGF